MSGWAGGRVRLSRVFQREPESRLVSKARGVDEHERNNGQETKTRIRDGQTCKHKTFHTYTHHSRHGVGSNQDKVNSLREISENKSTSELSAYCPTVESRG